MRKELYIPQTRDQLYLKLQQYFLYAIDTKRKKSLTYSFSSEEEAVFVLHESLKNVFSSEPGKLARLRVTADEAFAAARSGEVDLACDKFCEIVDEVR
ncbi:MAG: hypothetical protein AAGE92_17110 [Cyanobacteria bacterium P01_G01_bin.4]